MYKSSRLIQALIDAKLISNRLCDKKKAQVIIKEHFSQIHKEAVQETIIAKNKPNYKTPEYND